MDEESKEYWDEISVLSPTNIIKRNDENSDESSSYDQLSLKKLCMLANLNEVDILAEFSNFTKEFKSLAAEMQEEITNRNYIDIENEIEEELANDHGSDDDNDCETKSKRNRLEWVLLSEFFACEGNRQKYKNVHALYQFVFTIPSAQVECERSFSVMKNVKSTHRASTSDETLETYMIVKSSLDILPASVLPELIDMTARSSIQLRKKLELI